MLQNNKWIQSLAFIYAGLILHTPLDARVAVGPAGATADPVKQQHVAPKLVFDFAEIAEKATPGIVSIEAVQNKNADEEDIAKRFNGTPWEDFFKNFLGKSPKQNQKIHVGGAGFLIKIDSKFAYIVTNSHIVENVVKAKIFLFDKTEVPAVIHGKDPRSDLAVLKFDLKEVPVDTRKKLVALSWGNSDNAKVGNWVIAIGNPFGLGNTVTHGIISAKSRDLRVDEGALNDDFIQHSAPINMGNSGGCLLNITGEVVGVNTLIITPSSGNVGIGFAIPSKTAQHIVAQLLEKQKIHRGALGIKVQDFTKEMAKSFESEEASQYKEGAVIVYIDPDGPAAKAHLKSGDIIVKFDDTLITGSTRLSHVVGDAQTRTKHTVTIIRSQKIKEVTVELGDYDEINNSKDGGNASDTTDSKEHKILGLTLMDAKRKDLPDHLRPAENEEVRGAFVVKVSPDSDAEEVGIIQGCIIEEVNQKAVQTALDVVNAIKTAQKNGKETIFLKVRRGKEIRFISLKLNEDVDVTEGADSSPSVKTPEPTPKKSEPVSELEPTPAPSSEPKAKTSPAQPKADQGLASGMGKFRSWLDQFKKNDTSKNIYH